MSKVITVAQALDTVRALKAGEALPTVMVGNTEYFPRKTVKYLAGLSNEIENTQLVLAKNTKSTGVRNINSDQLDYAFLPIGVRIRFDITTASVTPLIAVWDDKAPVYWDNGEITFFQDIVLAELPVSVIAPDYSVSAPNNHEDDFFGIAPFLIRPNKPFKITSDLAGTASAGHAYRLEILGIEFVKNTRN